MYLNKKEFNKPSLNENVANMFALFSIIRGTFNNLGFTHTLDQSQLSGICFNKIVKAISKRSK